MSEHEIMTVEEVAEMLRVSERTIYDWAQKGEIPCGKLGNTWRFKRNEVSRWVDERLGGPRGGEQAVPSEGMARSLKPERVLILDGETKEQALEVLADVLAADPAVTDRNELLAALRRREGLMSTGIGLGVGVPHVRLESVKDLVMAVGIHHEGIADYEALDGDPVHVVCMVAAPNGQHERYLKLLSIISRKLKEEGYRRSLLAAPDASAVYRLLVS